MAISSIIVVSSQGCHNLRHNLEPKMAISSIIVEISLVDEALLKGLERASRVINDWIYVDVVRRGIARLLSGEEIVNW